MTNRRRYVIFAEAWIARYKDAVLAGELTAADSVRDYLALLAADGS